MAGGGYYIYGEDPDDVNGIVGIKGDTTAVTIWKPAYQDLTAESAVIMLSESR